VVVGAGTVVGAVGGTVVGTAFSFRELDPVHAEASTSAANPTRSATLSAGGPDSVLGTRADVRTPQSGITRSGHEG